MTHLLSRTSLSILLSICMAAALTAPACATAVSGPSDPAAGRAIDLDILDQNSDSLIDPFEVLDGLLQLQADRDGSPLSADEFAQAMDAFEEANREEALELIEAADADADGRTTVAEVDDLIGEDMGSGFDGNGDGVVTVEELQSTNFESVFLMDQEEILAEATGLYAEFDRDGDRSLTRDEVDDAELWEFLGETDRDGNGLLDHDEVVGFMTANNTPASFAVVGERAFMSGVICSGTPAEVLRLIFEHPDVRIIEMTAVPGSIDDEANLRAASYVRRHGFTTILRGDAMVASGGTDFFLAGFRREIETGARLGIHSWGGPGAEGKDVPEDDPQHQLYLSYYEQMDIPAAFYWRTLEAAPADGVHWMTEAELQEFGFRTGASE